MGEVVGVAMDGPGRSWSSIQEGTTEIACVSLASASLEGPCQAGSGQVDPIMYVVLLRGLTGFRSIRVTPTTQ